MRVQIYFLRMAGLGVKAIFCALNKSSLESSQHPQLTLALGDHYTLNEDCILLQSAPWLLVDKTKSTHSQPKFIHLEQKCHKKHCQETVEEIKVCAEMADNN